MSTPVQALHSETPVPPDWPRLLVRQALARFARRHLPDEAELIKRLSQPRLSEALQLGEAPWPETLASLKQQLPPLPAALARLVRDFQLQAADLFLLALCGEVEQSHDLNMLIAALQAPDEGARPSMHLTSAILADQFQIQLPPGRLQQHALLRSGILQMQGDQPLPLRTLSIDPELWNLLCGSVAHWPGISPINTPAQLDAHTEHLAQQAAQQLRSHEARGLVLRGDPDSARPCATRLAKLLKLQPVSLALETWQETPLAAAACRFAGWLPIIEHELSPGEQLQLKSHAQFPVPPVLITGNDGAVRNPDFTQMTLPKPAAAERLALWQQLLGQAPELPALAGSALLDQQRIHAIARQVQENLWPEDFSLGRRIAQVRTHMGTHRLRTLAHPVERYVDADALVLNAGLSARFDALLQRCVQREQLWDQLGPTLENTRNHGVRALFSGDSGTGKTLAASRLASALHAPLFRLDMASLMNKYIGETEKNLSALLDEAAATDVVLLLDEADALFGKRSDGDSGGERFANMLTNFLLTRIESHPGIVILTSNSQARIDQAFTRRFDAVLEFTPPGVEERLRLWANHLGDRSPGHKECELLASYCDLPGGYIRNTVLNAAALQPLNEHPSLHLRVILAALHEEYRKLGRALPPSLEQLRGKANG